MDYRWYDPTWGDLVSPVVPVVVMLVIGVLWEVRVLSNRAYLGLTYASMLGYLAHFDHVVYTSGWDSLPPIKGWAPLPIRYVAYAAAWAYLLWAAWGWMQFKEGKDEMERLRGMQYLRERLRRRKRD
jgi:hypothetical protein